MSFGWLYVQYNIFKYPLSRIFIHLYNTDLTGHLTPVNKATQFSRSGPKIQHYINPARFIKYEIVNHIPLKVRNFLFKKYILFHIIIL
ncbi:hypothetical protein D3M71_03770 [Erwinia billingiae]|nr:hypothetical protein [Erwinia billingiae]